MLGKLLIGGVTLATVGYGIKQFCEEEGCDFFDDVFEEDETSSYSETFGSQREHTFQNDREALLNFYYYKVSLYETTMAEFQELNLQIKNSEVDALKYSEFEFEDEQMPKSMNEIKKILKRIKKYSIFLDQLDTQLRDALYKLRGIIEVSHDYTTYTLEDKSVVKEAFVLAKTIETLCHVNILNKKGEVSKASKKLLKSCKASLEEGLQRGKEAVEITLQELPDAPFILSCPSAHVFNLISSPEAKSELDEDALNCPECGERLQLDIEKENVDHMMNLLHNNQ